MNNKAIFNRQEVINLKQEIKKLRDTIHRRDKTINNQYYKISKLEKEKIQLLCQTKGLREIYNIADEEIDKKTRKINYLIKALKKCSEILGDDYNLDI